MFDGFISEEDKKFNIDDLSDFISELLNKKIEYIYKPIKMIIMLLNQCRKILHLI